MEKIDARTLKPEVQEQLRMQAVQLRKKGHSIQQIAGILDVNPGTVYRWCQLYEHGGAKSIRIRKRGRPTGACRKLTTEQEKQLQRLIRDKQRSVETALRPVVADCCPATDQAVVGYAHAHPDRWGILETLGVYPAKAFSACLRAEPQKG
jgi:transposase